MSKIAGSDQETPFSIEIRVDYSDTDAMGIVHHANYFRWFERARIEWLRAQGHSYAHLEKEGLALPLLSAEVVYRKSLYFDQSARIEVRITEVAASLLTIQYRLFTAEGLATEASTRHALCRKSTTESGELRWKMTRIPADWREKWQPPKEPKS